MTDKTSVICRLIIDSCITVLHSYPNLVADPVDLVLDIPVGEDPDQALLQIPNVPAVGSSLLLQVSAHIHKHILYDCGSSASVARLPYLFFMNCSNL